MYKKKFYESRRDTIGRGTSMRYWVHVPNSLRNKNVERHIPYLL
jgi:hypothetical protein